MSEENDEPIENEDCLSTVARRLSEKFNNLRIWMKSEYILVSPLDTLTSDLVFIPLFHAVLTNFEKDVIVLKVVAYNGKVVHESEGHSVEKILECEVLEEMDSNSLKLCSGVMSNHFFAPEDGGMGVIREYVRNKIVIRSEKCEFMVKGKPACIQCQNHFNVKSVVKEEEISQNDHPIASPQDFKGKTKVISFNNRSDVMRTLRPKEYFDMKPKIRYDWQPRKKEKRPLSSMFHESEADDIYEKEDGKKVLKKTFSNRSGYNNEAKNIEIHYVNHEEFQIFCDGKRLDTDDFISNKKKKQKCPHCGRNFLQITAYERHKEKCLAGPGKTEEDVLLARPERCILCLKRFTSKKMLQLHMTFHKERHKEDLERTPVHCPECKMDVGTMYDLNTHYQNVHDSSKGVCIHCFAIVLAGKVRRHLYEHFYDENKHLCSLCGKKFSKVARLEAHIAEEHDKSDANTVVCDICGRIFSHKVKLNAHKYNYHPKKIHQCHSCDKTFTNSVKYYSHVKTHSYTKPWRCKICGYKTVKKCNVAQHVERVHKMDRQSAYANVYKVGQYAYKALEKREKEAEAEAEAEAERQTAAPDPVVVPSDVVPFGPQVEKIEGI